MKSKVYLFTALLYIPNNKVHGANMGPTGVLSAPDGPHVGPMNLAIEDNVMLHCTLWKELRLCQHQAFNISGTITKEHLKIKNNQLEKMTICLRYVNIRKNLQKVCYNQTRLQLFTTSLQCNITPRSLSFPSLESPALARKLSIIHCQRWGILGGRQAWQLHINPALR